MSSGTKSREETSRGKNGDSSSKHKRSRSDNGKAKKNSSPPAVAVPELRVSGCTDASFRAVIEGNYASTGSNHNKPVWKKKGAGDDEVIIYYWDGRDGEEMGWWFGPSIGNQLVWAFHKDTSGDLAPKSGWRVPYDGPLDKSLRVTYSDPSKLSGSTDKKSKSARSAAAAAVLSKGAAVDEESESGSESDSSSASSHRPKAPAPAAAAASTSTTVKRPKARGELMAKPVLPRRDPGIPRSSAAAPAGPPPLPAPKPRKAPVATAAKSGAPVHTVQIIEDDPPTPPGGRSSFAASLRQTSSKASTSASAAAATAANASPSAAASSAGAGIVVDHALTVSSQHTSFLEAHRKRHQASLEELKQLEQKLSPGLLEKLRSQELMWASRDEELAKQDDVEAHMQRKAASREKSNRNREGVLTNYIKKLQRKIAEDQKRILELQKGIEAKTKQVGTTEGELARLKTEVAEAQKREASRHQDWEQKREAELQQAESELQAFLEELAKQHAEDQDDEKKEQRRRREAEEREVEEAAAQAMAEQAEADEEEARKVADIAAAATVAAAGVQGVSDSDNESEAKSSDRGKRKSRSKSKKKDKRRKQDKDRDGDRDDADDSEEEKNGKQAVRPTSAEDFKHHQQQPPKPSSSLEGQQSFNPEDEPASKRRRERDQDRDRERGRSGRSPRRSRSRAEARKEDARDRDDRRGSRKKEDQDRDRDRRGRHTERRSNDRHRPRSRDRSREKSRDKEREKERARERHQRHSSGSPAGAAAATIVPTLRGDRPAAKQTDKAVSYADLAAEEENRRTAVESLRRELDSRGKTPRLLLEAVREGHGKIEERVWDYLSHSARSDSRLASAVDKVLAHCGRVEELEERMRTFLFCSRQVYVTDILKVEECNQLRKVDVGELFLTEHAPQVERSLNVQRIQGKLLKDGLECWMTTAPASPQDQPFLTVGSIFRCIRATKLEPSAFQSSKEHAGLSPQLTEGSLVKVVNWRAAGQGESPFGVEVVRAEDGFRGWLPYS
eukprot:CAMPEP_0206532428 /NCGR_PEP_ID=MMETSP0325_2-20121206/4372_1 /ASSEMBLY_ACC=CAM_ASM_000347 /TAXON_ID=2866 /ORGANISM="Crypthecodinium cohnii, Strain Seligo" /LENGTH=1013 /DNA_ID=CAMNT_0054028895 /DNA_START=93 /DNA_END=3130 /DNA_ORIENTATION=-